MNTKWCMLQEGYASNLLQLSIRTRDVSNTIIILPNVIIYSRQQIKKYLEKYIMFIYKEMSKFNLNNNSKTNIAPSNDVMLCYR